MTFSWTDEVCRCMNSWNDNNWHIIKPSSFTQVATLSTRIMLAEICTHNHCKPQEEAIRKYSKGLCWQLSKGTEKNQNNWFFNNDSTSVSPRGHTTMLIWIDTTILKFHQKYSTYWKKNAMVKIKHINEIILTPCSKTTLTENKICYSAKLKDLP